MEWIQPSVDFWHVLSREAGLNTHQLVIACSVTLSCGKLQTFMVKVLLGFSSLDLCLRDSKYQRTFILTACSVSPVGCWLFQGVST
ncbi:unnamed protein product [Arctogadus glacialis]